MSFGLTTYDELGNTRFDLGHYPFTLVDSFVPTTTTGSKQYPQHSDKTIYALSHPFNKSGLLPVGNAVPSVSGYTVSWNIITPAYVSASTDYIIQVYVR
jgi:hypothetical protein